jgi:hypothetical protein
LWAGGTYLPPAFDVMRVRSGERGGIDLRALSCQLLGKPETEFTAEDAEGVFDLLGTEPNPGQRRVVIIEGAEQLRGDALGYLHLLSSIAGDAMPQILFVGGPSFPEENDGTTTDLRALVAFRRDLAPLTAEEAGQFIDLSAPPRALRSDVRASLIRHADGSIERLAALLTLTESIRKEQRRRRVRETFVDMAAARLDAVAEPAASAGGLASEPSLTAGSQEDDRSRLAFARTPILVEAAILLIAGLGSWHAWEKGLRLGTVAASPDGRHVKVIALSAPAAVEVVENQAQAAEPPPSAEHASARAEAPAEESGGSPAPGREPAMESAVADSVHHTPEAMVKAASLEQHGEPPAAVPAPPALATATPPAPATEPDARRMVSRGDDMLALGDITAARLCYERAAALGSATAATSLGKTYDPLFLEAIRSSGVLSDRDHAATLYRKAIALGDRDAEPLLARLNKDPGPR